MKKATRICWLCERKYPLLVRGEDKERIIKALDKSQLIDAVRQCHTSPTICKDCCIGVLEGHNCVW